MHITEVHDDAVRSRFAHAHMVSTGEGSILLHDRGVLGLYPCLIYFLTGSERGLYPFMDYFPCWHEGHSKLTSKAANLSKWGALLSQKLFATRSIEANRGRGQIFARKQGPNYALGK